MDEVCNISNKNQPPSNLAKYQYFYIREFVFLLHFEINLALSMAKSAKKRFLQRTPYTPPSFQTKTCTFHHRCI